MKITVFCGSSRRASETHRETARRLGSAIARAGHVLVFGGGRTGLMGAVADGALAAGGSVQAVILRDFIERDVHHRGVEDLDAVGDMRSRKAGLDERADAFIALPGGYGTLEEVSEILSFRKLGLHARPVILLNAQGFFGPLIAQIDRAIADGYDGPEARGFFEVTDDPERAVRLCEGAPGASPPE